MHFDGFLANLLFGLTLFTAFMSLAHSLGDLICKWFAHDSRFRAGLRALAMLLCGLVALKVFLYKLGEDNRERIDETAEMKIQMYRASQGMSQEPAESARFERIDPASSMVLRDQPAAETLTEGKMLEALLARTPAVHSLITAKSAELCQGWQQQAQELGIKIYPAPHFPAPGTPNLVMVCASDPSFHEALANVAPYLAAGGSVLVIGALKNADEQTALAKLLGVAGWVRPPAPPPTLVTLGGRFFSWGGLPAGLRVGLGPDWSALEGGLLALPAAAPGSEPVALADGGGGMPLVAAEPSGGRLIWTSLPAVFFGKAGTLLKPYWKIATARLFVYLARLPLVGFRATPASPAVAVPMMIGTYEAKRAGALGGPFKRLGVRASFYVSLDETESHAEPEELVKNLLADGQEVGAVDFSASTGSATEFFSELARYHNWREAFRRIHPMARSAEGECCRLGATLEPGAQAHAFGAAKMVGFDHVAGFPFQDWVSPFELAIESVAAKSAKTLTVLPTFTGGDLKLQSTQGAPELGAVRDWIQAQVAEAKWKGGAAILAMHTHVLGAAPAALENVLGELRTQGVRFLSVGDYLNWWHAKSRLEWRLESFAARRVLFEVKNNGGVLAMDLVLSEPGSGWRLVGEGARVQLKPGETIRVVVERQP